MIIEDDFIEDSEPDDTSEENSRSVFLTQTKAEAPIEIEMKPAVNIYPLTTLSQQLLSAMYSLMMFGRSDIKATVSGSIFDLGKNLNKIRDAFPEFFRETKMKINSQQYKMEKQLLVMKNNKKKLIKENGQLKALIRSYSKQIPQKAAMLDSRENDFSEMDRIKGELRAVTVQLKSNIKKLRDLAQQNEKMSTENKEIQKQIDLIQKNYRKKYCHGDLGELNKNIMKAELEIQNNILKHKEMISNIKQMIESYKNPIAMLEARLNDLNRRISQMPRFPLTDRTYRRGRRLF